MGIQQPLPQHKPYYGPPAPPVPAPLDDPDLHDFVIDQFETDGMTAWLSDLRFSARATVKLW